MASTSDLPYWLVNVPRDEWPAECPDYLKNASPRPRALLSTPDKDYRRLDWAQVTAIVKANQLDKLSRVPSQFRRYLLFNSQLKANWGSVMDFILQRRLKWSSLTPADPTPFSNTKDIRILYNDWPYGFEPAITHLVMWVRFAVAEDPTTGDLTPEARQQTQSYVDSTFGKNDRVLWFKNWASLKSVKAIEHFHVLLHDADPEFLYKITNGDVPMHALDADGLAAILKR